MKRITFLIALVALLLLAGSALAMDSENYSLDWFTPLTSNGGGSVSSANYAINFTVGQTVIGAPDSASYAGCLGYWCGGSGSAGHTIYLPLVLRNHS